MSNCPEALLDVSETARLLRISVSTLRRWIHQKQIEHFKIGGRVLFSKQIISGFLENNKVKPWISKS